MNTTAANSRVHEFCFPVPDASARVAAASGPECDRAQRETIVRWRVNRLFWVKDALSLAISPAPDDRRAESGMPGQRGFRSWSGDVEVDVRSPLNGDAFCAMSLAAQIEYLRTWKPEPSDWDGPAREGLAATLQVEVTTRPMLYFENAGQYIGLDPMYATAMVRGFSEGLEGKAVPNWKPFWEFASWVLGQPDPETEIQDGFSGKTQLGRRWPSCRLEIARFLDATLNGELAPLPLTERAQVWRLVAALARDPNPSPADEAPGDEPIMDPFTLSQNTVRGVAAHAVFSFVHWIRSESPQTALAGQDLDDAPEARAALEAYLDPNRESSQMIRSVVGANLTRLSFWAEAWLRGHLETIFPAPGHDELREAAWEAFIRFSRPDSKTVALLAPQYCGAISRMSQDPVRKRGHNDPRVSLGQHLVVNFCRGDHDFEQPGGLLAAFFARAPEAVRAEVLALVGRSLDRASGPVPTRVFSRLLWLWNWQLQREPSPGGPGVEDEAA